MLRLTEQTQSLLREVVIILAISLFAATLCAFFHPKRPTWYQVVDEDVKRWSIDEARAAAIMKTGPVLWVDARAAKKYQEKHFPGAISLDTENFADLVIQHQVDLQNAMGNPVIVYCDGTRCEKSQEIAKKLRELLGLEPVYLLKGKWQNLIPAQNP